MTSTQPAPEVVGVPVSQAQRMPAGETVVGVPITQTRDEFDDDNLGYQSPDARQQPRQYRPVTDSRSEAPATSHSPNAYGNNASFSQASPGGGVAYYGGTPGQGSEAASPQQNEGRPRSTSTSGQQQTRKRVVKISAEEVNNWKAAFNVSQETVIQALKEAKGDREKTVQLLQQGPNRVPNISAGNSVQVKKNVIRISQSEITSFAKMFNKREREVVQVMKEVKGDRDKAIARLSSNGGNPMPSGRSASGAHGVRVTVQEAEQLAAIFGVADRKREIQDIVNVYGHDKDLVMGRLETLASQPVQQAAPVRSESPGNLDNGDGSNAWDAPSNKKFDTYGGATNGGLGIDDVEILADDDFLGGASDHIGGGGDGFTDTPSQNYNPATASGRSAADIDGPPPAGTSFAPRDQPVAPDGNSNDPGYAKAGRQEQMLPPAPGSW